MPRQRNYYGVLHIVHKPLCECPAPPQRLTLPEVRTEVGGGVHN